jgi:hypothetical protein
MGRPHQAQRCAVRALLLYALAYDGIVMEEETRSQLADLEEYVEAD